MNTPLRSTAVAAAIFLTTLVLATPATAQQRDFRFDEGRLQRGMLFEYRKSNLDGTHASDISVHVRDGTEVESFKRWSEPATRATLVKAQMDWHRFSVRGFQVFELNCGQEPQPRAQLEVGEKEFRISVAPHPVPLTRVPWHSYDFDFTSLSLAMPMLKNPRGSFTFGRSDFQFEPTMEFKEMGEVVMKYQGRERRHDRATRRYSIGGPGLRDAVGTWWADARTGTLVEFELPIPDEPGYDSVRLRLLATQPMRAEDWEQRKQDALCKAAS